MKFKDPLLNMTVTDGLWFAWRPVTTTDGYVVWLERVKRTWLDQWGWEYTSL